jgi:hypothetical protein
MSKKETKKPTSGQSSKEKLFGYSELDPKKEQPILRALLPAKGQSRPVLSISEIQEACGWKSLGPSKANPEFTGKARGNSRVRNALRKLVPSYWVENYPHKGSGKYRLTKEAVDELRDEGVTPLKAKTSTKSKSKRARDRKTKEAEQIAF